MSKHDDLQPLVQIEQKSIAHLFANYLITLGITAQVIAKPKSAEQPQIMYTILCQHQHFSQAKNEFEAFIKHPYHNKYQQAAWQHGETISIDRNDATLLATFKENFFAHAGIVTLVVFAFCWLIFIVSNLGWAQPVFDYLHFYNYLSINSFIEEPWRLLGPVFFHFSWLHIIFNTMWWWQLGGSIEKTLGKGSLINLLLISAIISNLGQFFVSGANFGGLSGVVYALVGFVWWMGYLAPEKGLSLSKPIVGFLLFWIVLGFADFLPVNMANTAHLLGLLSGCLFAVLKVKIFKQ
ncbi:MAG: rhomboid family intramembrane serine protease GlpG [Colwellia sp.]|nr:rhomboid family intramembrane serine protease GlpG [Colwellia sp.]